ISILSSRTSFVMSGGCKITGIPIFSISATRTPPRNRPQANTSKRDLSRYLAKIWMAFSVPPRSSRLHANITLIFAMSNSSTSEACGETSYGAAHNFAFGTHLGIIRDQRRLFHQIQVQCFQLGRQQSRIKALSRFFLSRLSELGA